MKTFTVIEKTNLYGQTVRVTVNQDGVEVGLRSTRVGGEWSHSVGRKAHGYANWEVTTKDGMNPSHEHVGSSWSAVPS
jgi:hypothetical protein